ncbi:MAG: Pr6Pr family membrane protein [Christensenellaceae bacterium]|nr:Pr6Pr family membrane protein [Christensenellaceae bacterium]
MNELIKNNRITALVFRIVATLLATFGVLDGVGLFSNNMAPNILLYYTTQSNILVIGMFVILIVFSIKDIKNNGIKGSSSYCERATGIIMLAIVVTMLVFWLVLAPVMSASSVMGMSAPSLLSFQNFQLHLITPLLIIVDYFVFEKPGKLKKQDPWIFAAIPLSYFVQATILGFSGVVYMTLENGDVQHFPYFFIDYYAMGWKVALFVVGILIVFLALAYGLLLLDKKRANTVLRTKVIDAIETND